MGIWKQVIPVLTVMILLLTVFSLLGVQPAQIVEGRENIECTDPNTGTIYLVGNIDSKITLDKEEYVEGTINYTVTEVTIIINTIVHDPYILAADITVTFGIILPGDTTPTLDPAWTFRFVEFTGIVKNYTFTNVYSGTVSANAGDTIKVTLVYDLFGEASSAGPMDPFFPITRSPNPSEAFFIADVISSDQVFTLDGVVKTTRGSFVTGASVRLGDQTTFTVSGGRFTIAGIVEGDYTITVSQTGFKSYVNEISITKDDSITITLLTLDETPPPPTTDSDGDGFSDAEEIVAGTDPNDPDDFPEKDELPIFEWNNWVIILIIAAFVVAIIVFIAFGGGMMGGIFAAIAFLVLAVAAWLAGSGLLISAAIISLFMGG